MKLDKYTLFATRSHTKFRFQSIGPRGKINKIVEFQQTEIENYFNLAFGDLNIDSNDFDDLAISNNGDSEKVLATVVQALSDFLDAHPTATVYATGSTTVRTRLYQIGISRFGEEASDWLDIYGENESGFEPFVWGRKYQGFLVTKKIS